MKIPALESLVKIGKLKVEVPTRSEIEGLIVSARKRSVDARKPELSFESRFDLAYNASHGLALAALRTHGYRSDNRYIVFQALEHTAGLAPATWRIFSKAHDARNLAEYQGDYDVDEQLLKDLISCLDHLDAAVSKLSLPKKD